MLLPLLLLLSGLCEWTAASSAAGGVECIFFNEDYMTCDWSGKGKPAANYSLYYWYSGNSSIAQCKRYLRTEDGINTGCWFSLGEIEECCDFFVHVNASRAKDIRGEFGLVQHLVKPGQPTNVTVRNVSSNELLLTWATPFRDPYCLEHAVKYKTNKDSEWMEQKVQQMMFNIPSVDPDKLYTFYVRSKIGQTCGTTNLWSETTGPVFWGKDTPHSNGGSWFWIQNVLLPVGSFLLLLAFLVLLIRMERVWLVLMPRIPNPSRKFEDLFTAYQGNFSEWAGVSKDAVESFRPDYRESICRVSELLPGGGYLPICSDAVGKAGRAPGGSADHPPKASPE